MACQKDELLNPVDPELTEAQCISLGFQDECGVCDGDTTNDGYQDECGNCDSDTTNDGFMDECGNCDSDTTNDCGIYKLIFSDNFTTNDMSLFEYSSYWEYTGDLNYSSYNIIDNQLLIQSISGDGLAHRLWDYVLVGTKLVDRIELNVDIKEIDKITTSQNEEWMYGIFVADWALQKTYHFLLFGENNIKSFQLSTYNWDSGLWNTLAHESLSIVHQEKLNYNFKLKYEDQAIKLYLDDDYISGYSLPNFNCYGYGVYTQNNITISVDNLEIYGFEVESEIDLSKINSHLNLQRQSSTINRILLNK